MARKRQPGPIDPQTQVSHLEASLRRFEDSITRGLTQRETITLTLKVTIDRGTIRRVERFQHNDDQLPITGHVET